METEVYFIQASTGQIKIGRALSAQRRLGILQIGSPIPLKLMAVTKGTFRLERQLHERFNHLRIHGEWFSPGPELLELIDKVVANPGDRALVKRRAGAKAGPQPRLRARILMLMRGVGYERVWRPYDVGKILHEGTDDCGRIMRSSPEIQRIGEGQYRLLAPGD